MTARPAARVIASRRFVKTLRTVGADSEEYKVIEQALSVLKENMFAGSKVRRKIWPQAYLKSYGINNLYKLDLRGGRRLTYTIAAETKGYFVIVLDYFGSHKEYEVFFGY